MNRQQRREQKKQQKPVKKATCWNLTKEQTIERLMKNGISPADLKREFGKGYEAGFADAGKPTLEMAYACLCLTLHELYGFGEKRCYDTLTRMRDHMDEYLTSSEAARDVMKKIGLTLDLDDPFEPIQEV